MRSRRAGDRNAWKLFVDALCSTRSKRIWWWWWWLYQAGNFMPVKSIYKIEVPKLCTLLEKETVPNNLHSYYGCQCIPVPNSLLSDLTSTVNILTIALCLCQALSFGEHCLSPPSPFEQLRHSHHLLTGNPDFLHCQQRCSRSIPMKIKCHMNTASWHHPRI